MEKMARPLNQKFFRKFLNILSAANFISQKVWLDAKQGEIINLSDERTSKKKNTRADSDWQFRMRSRLLCFVIAHSTKSKDKWLIMTLNLHCLPSTALMFHCLYFDVHIKVNAISNWLQVSIYKAFTTIKMS